MVKKYLERKPFNYRQVPNSMSLIDTLGISIYPTHIILDGSGKIRELITGDREDITDLLSNSIEMLLREK